MWVTIGQDKAINELKKSLKSTRTCHAYLFVGPRQVGKMTLALDLAKGLNCVEDNNPCQKCSQCTRISRESHVDVRIIGLDSSTNKNRQNRVQIGIDQIREIQRESSLKPFEGSHRVYIFDGAEQLSEEASNCLLKTLEEPPDQVVLILLTSNTEILLPTLISRCRTLELKPVSKTLISREMQSRYNVDVSVADEIAHLSSGIPGWAMDAISNPKILEDLNNTLGIIEDTVSSDLINRFTYASNLASSFWGNRESVKKELSLWLHWWRDLLLTKEGVVEHVIHRSKIETFQTVSNSLSSAQIVMAIQAIRKTTQYLDINTNPRLALEELMLVIPKP